MKKHIISILSLMVLLGFTLTASASTIAVTGLDSWTRVQFKLGNTTYDEYAGEIKITIDGMASSAYCVDLFHTTYVPSGPYENVTLTGLNMITNGAQVAWLMDQYCGGTPIQNAALQLAIWGVEYGTIENPFSYIGNTGV